MSLARGFVDVCAGFRNPVMLQVSPMTTHGKAMNGANVVMSPNHGTGEALQNDAESSRRDIKAAGLKPHASRIGNPKTFIVDIDAGYEVFAASTIRLEAVGETLKS